MKETLVGEVLGLSNAGKTEHTRFVKRKLSDLGLKVSLIADKIREAPYDDEITRNEWAIAAVNKLIVEQSNIGKDIVLIDRGALAHLASIATIIIKIADTANLKIEEDKLEIKKFKVRDDKGRFCNIERLVKSMSESPLFDPEEIKIISKASTALNTAINAVNKEDFFIYIKVSPNICLERDKLLDKRSKSKIINDEHLLLMKGVYQCIEKNRLPKEKTLIINGEEDFERNQDLILSTILSLLPEKNNPPNGNLPTTLAVKEDTNGKDNIWEKNKTDQK